jgi:hypothetical protein
MYVDIKEDCHLAYFFAFTFFSPYSPLYPISSPACNSRQRTGKRTQLMPARSLQAVMISPSAPTLPRRQPAAFAAPSDSASELFLDGRQGSGQIVHRYKDTDPRPLVGAWAARFCGGGILADLAGIFWAREKFDWRSSCFRRNPNTDSYLHAPIIQLTFCVSPARNKKTKPKPANPSTPPVPSHRFPNETVANPSLCY